MVFLMTAPLTNVHRSNGSCKLGDDEPVNVLEAIVLGEGALPRRDGIPDPRREARRQSDGSFSWEP